MPGFRSGTRWKQIVAILGYAVIALSLIGGVAAGEAFWFAFGLIGLGAVILATNVGGLATACPCSPPNCFAAVGGWDGLALVSVIVLMHDQATSSGVVRCS